MLAFAVVTLAVLFVLAIYTAGMRDYAHSETAARAFRLAQGRLELLMICPMGSVTTSSGSFAAPDAEFSYQIDAAPHLGALHNLDVKVTVRHDPTHIARSLCAVRAPSLTPPGYRAFLGHACPTCHRLSQTSFNRPDFNSVLVGPTLGKMSGSDGALEVYRGLYGSDNSYFAASLTADQFFRDSVRTPERFVPKPYRYDLDDPHSTQMAGAFNSPSHQEYLTNQELGELYTWLESMPGGH